MKDEDGTPEKLVELQAKYADIMSSNFVLESELEELRKTEEREAHEAIKKLETPKKDDEEGADEAKSDEVVPMTPIIDELTEAQSLNKKYFDRVYTTDQQYLEYVRNKLAPYIYKTKANPDIITADKKDDIG